MSKPQTPNYPQIQPASVVTGADATNQAMQLTNQYFAPQMGAQAQGIADIGQGTNYYNSYQPTSFAQALGNQSFQNIWPNEQAYMQNLLSQSGMAYSPTEATTLGNAYGNLSTNIGEYLNQQGNTEATNNLSALLGINPTNYSTPILNAITGQSNQQAGLNQQATMQNADATYSNSLANYNQQLATGQAIGTGVGALGGLAVGGPAGAIAGAGIGGSLMGGSNSGSSLSNYLLASQYMGQTPGQTGTTQSNPLYNSVDSQYNSLPSNQASSVYGISSQNSLPQNPYQ